MANGGFDSKVRWEVYRRFVETTHAPKMAKVAAAVGAPRDEAVAAAQRLHQGRAGIVLQDDGELLMAAPFSAVPTPFVVEADGKSWWSPCVWDAFGVPALLGRDARIVTSCGCCRQAMTVEIAGGAVRCSTTGAVAHLLVPARHFFDNIVFTWQNMLLFRSEEHVARWCEKWEFSRGAVLTLEQQRQISFEWFHDRLSPEWRRWPVEEIEAKFARAGLTGEFWRLR